MLAFRDTPLRWPLLNLRLLAMLHACVIPGCQCQSYVQGLTPAGEIIATANSFNEECICCEHAYYEHQSIVKVGMKGVSAVHRCGGFVAVEVSISDSFEAQGESHISQGETLNPRSSLCAACNGPWMDHDTVLSLGSCAAQGCFEQPAESSVSLPSTALSSNHAQTSHRLHQPQPSTALQPEVQHISSMHSGNSQLPSRAQQYIQQIHSTHQEKP